MLLPPQRHPEPAEPHRQRPDGRVRGSLHRWIFLYHTRMSVIADIRLARLICRTGGNGLERRRTAAPRPRQRAIAARSEEHTSELQSLMRISYAVFCLKKTKEHNAKT